MGIIKRLREASQKIDQIIREEIDEPRRDRETARPEPPRPARRR
ncbi:hypothetical protein [Prauserella sp. PE36]|nr:hypothetical protein [Prauserella sp. PE36]